MRPDTLIRFLETGEQDLSEELRAPATETMTAPTGRNRRASAVD